MTNISNFTISENMNARLAEYGLTSAMAEENGCRVRSDIGYGRRKRMDTLRFN